MPEYLAPGVYVEEISSGDPGISSASTDLTAFVGWTPHGPLHEAVPIRDPQDFDEAFGGVESRNWLGCMVRHFFGSGGREAIVVRIAGKQGGVVRPGTPAFRSALFSGRRSGVSLLTGSGFNLLCVPGEASRDTVARLQDFSRHHRAFLIVDTSRKETIASLESGSAVVLPGSAGDHSALYFPWVRAPDPRTGRMRAFPPSGFVAGVYARNDATRGVWKSPAGIDAGLGSRDVPAVPAISITADQLARLNSKAVNCIRTVPGAGTVIWGARTLASDQEWKYVSVRRTASYLEESLYQGTRWAVFEPNATETWARVRVQVEAFLATLFRQGAFAGSSPEKAFVVRCDASTTTRADIDDGILNVLVGFAPLKPAEFVIIRVRQRMVRS